MKKLLTFLLSIIMITSLTACGEKEKEEKFGGTWKVDFIEYEGAKFTVEEWNTMHEDDLSDFYIIFKDGGKAYIYDDGYGDLVNWLNSDDSIMIDDEKYSIVEENICFDYYGDIIYLKKVSNNQEIPKEENDDETSDEDLNVENDSSDNETTSPETTVSDETTSTETTASTETTSASNELRKEFKDAMDSYEAFFDEYVAFMKKYMASNGTDLSLLTDYAKYMSKYTEMMQDFENWENSDMNTAEAAYYIQVQTRINNKLLEIAN